MEDYPPYSLDHNIPLLITIGLPPAEKDADWTLDPGLKDQATLLRSELPLLEGSHAAAFSQYITEGGPQVAPWKGRANANRYLFRVRTAGRTYYLPPRRARLPENFEPPPSPAPVPLHSPYSPLSPSCALYPDGIIDAGWIQKHQELVPSLFLCFYALTADPNTATLQDNKIKADIQAFRTAVQQSGYRSRVAVAVFADEAVASSGADVLQERLENIRKGSGVDAKLFFVASADATEEELARVAENMLALLTGPATDYYRELGRHARKRRSRSSAPQPAVPPTSGTSQTLSLPGWHVRADVKCGVLAEFRQEWDNSLRSYEQAYDVLVGADVLDSAIPSWSPRFNEARLLADLLAIRCVRGLLHLGQPSAAVRRWSRHRAVVRQLVDTRGRGTNNYGWAAWEARWARLMAELVEDVVGASQIYLGPEKTLVAERLSPWDHLHHAGYWHRMAARHLYTRRALARAIPEDDRRPPDISPTSKVASRAFAYDDYMCPPPHEEAPLAGVSHGKGVDHSQMIVAALEMAREAYVERRQTAMAAEVALECGREHVQAQNWQAAFYLLAPLWAGSDGAIPSYRRDGWFAIHEELAWNLRAAAVALAQADQLVAIDWEMLDSRYTQRGGWHYDVSKALLGDAEAGAESGTRKDEKDAESEEADKADKKKKKHIKFLPNEAPSFLQAAFSFKAGEGKAGQVLPAQLAITSNAFAGTPPIVLDEVRVQFDGSIKPVLLRHGPEAASTDISTTPNRIAYSAVSLEEDDEPDAESELHVARWHGVANCTLTPQTTSVYELAIPLREAGDARAVAVHLRYACAQYTLRLTVPFTDPGRGKSWYLPSGARAAFARADGQAVHVQPRPPKLDIRIEGPQQEQAEEAAAAAASNDKIPKPTTATPPAQSASAEPAHTLQFYTNEPVDLPFAIFNGEDADAMVKLDVTMFGDDAPGFTLLVAGEEIDTAPPALSGDAAAAADPEGDGDGDGDGDGASALPSVPLGVVATGQALRGTIHMAPVALSTALDLTLRAVYHLVDDPATPITQTLAVKLSLSNPFEANYDLLPRLHPDAWPSIFNYDAGMVVEEAGEAKEAKQATETATATAASTPHGLIQAWTVVTRFASFAAEDLRVVDLDLIIQPVPGIVVRHSRTLPDLPGDDDDDPSSSSNANDPSRQGPLIIKPQTMEHAEFGLVAQKASLDHRDAAGLDVSFVIKWQRKSGAAGKSARPPVNTTVLPVPRLGIFGSEPRVLASVAYASGSGAAGPGLGKAATSAAVAPPPLGSRLIFLDITIENPSSHFLTFGLNMEPSNDFAFSGTKMTTVHVLPISRRTVSYRLLPLVHGTEHGEGSWIRPALVVRDKYFQKVLRILPTEGLKMDKDGILVWVPPDEDEDDEDGETEEEE